MSNRKWRPHLKKKAEKQLNELSPNNKARVLSSIEELAQAENPLILSGVKHLKGSNPKQWRQRQGDYRIIFEIQPEQFIEMGVEYKGKLIINSISLHHTGY